MERMTFSLMLANERTKCFLKVGLFKFFTQIQLKNYFVLIIL